MDKLEHAGKVLEKVPSCSVVKKAKSQLLKVQ